MKRITSMQYTIREVPQRVDEALRRKARREGKSLNQTAILALARGLGLDGTAPKLHDLDDLAGTWVDDPAFDEAVRDMDQVDPELWK